MAIAKAAQRVCQSRARQCPKQGHLSTRCHRSYATRSVNLLPYDAKPKPKPKPLVQARPSTPPKPAARIPKAPAVRQPPATAESSKVRLPSQKIDIYDEDIYEKSGYPYIRMTIGFFILGSIVYSIVNLSAKVPSYGELTIINTSSPTLYVSTALQLPIVISFQSERAG